VPGGDGGLSGTAQWARAGQAENLPGLVEREPWSGESPLNLGVGSRTVFDAGGKGTSCAAWRFVTRHPRKARASA
jgi:hypothetical protein